MNDHNSIIEAQKEQIVRYQSRLRGENEVNKINRSC